MNHIMKKLFKLEDKNLINNNDFIDDITKQKFYDSLNQWVTSFYLYTINSKIISFCMMMEENLIFGFLHYHVSSQYNNYFINNYSILNQKTSQIYYLYVSTKYRKQNIASELLKFLFYDLRKRDYKFVWLINETISTIYEKFHFVDFSGILKQLNIKESFLKDYYLKCGYTENKLINYYGDRRVVKKL